MKGEVSTALTDETVGCAFAPRCPFAQDVCRTVSPELSEMSGNGRQAAACHFTGELSLEGVE